MFSSRVSKQAMFSVAVTPLLPAFYVWVSGNTLDPGRIEVVLGWISFGSVSFSSTFWKLEKPSHKTFVFVIWPWSSVPVGNTYTFIWVCWGNFNVWATFKDVRRKSTRMIHTLHLVGSFSHTGLHKVGGILLVPPDLWGTHLGAHKCSGKYHGGYLFQLHSSVLFREWLFIKLTQKSWYQAALPMIQKGWHLELVGKQDVPLESRVGKLCSSGL